MTKRYLIAIFVCLGVIALLTFFNKEKEDTPESIFKCPEEMNSFEEYTLNRTEIMALFLKENPNYSQEEITTKVIEIAEKRNCTNDVSYLNEYKKTINAEEAPITLISDEDLAKEDLIEYKSKIGLSFKHSTSTKVFETMANTYYIIVEPIAETKDRKSIIISIAQNDENITAEEWLIGENSGFDPTQEVYFKTKIADQDAVYTDSGMWAVLNNPDNKYRLSIAELTMGEEVPMYKEMGIILKTLKFE